jgi:hypothetical protein
VAPFAVSWRGQGRQAKELVMPYFDKGQDTPTRAGKLIGDAIAGLVYLAVILLALDAAFRIV